MSTTSNATAKKPLAPSKEAMELARVFKARPAQRGKVTRDRLIRQLLDISGGRDASSK